MARAFDKILRPRHTALGVVDVADVVVRSGYSLLVAYAFKMVRAFWKASKASAYRPWLSWMMPMLL
jgi:hypothetical protein